MSRWTNYGPGDEETWAPCCGHPNDPRSDDYEEEEDQEDDDEDAI